MGEAKPKLKEADVQRAVVEFLELDGWRAIRTDSSLAISRSHEVGMPDYLFLRYESRQGAGAAPLAEVLWIEFKAPRKKPTQRQVEWQLRERARGALVLVVDDADKFREWYAASGLARKVRT